MLLCNTYSPDMIFLRAIKLHCIGLIAMLLLSQSVVAQHSIDHVWHGSTELCEIYLSAESPCLTKASVITTDSTSYGQNLNDFLCSQRSGIKPSKPLARGPPLLS